MVSLNLPQEPKSPTKWSNLKAMHVKRLLDVPFEMESLQFLTVKQSKCCYLRVIDSAELNFLFMQDQRSDPENSIQVGTSCTGGVIWKAHFSIHLHPANSNHPITLLNFSSISFIFLISPDFFYSLKVTGTCQDPLTGKSWKKIQIQKGTVCVNE